MLGDGAASRRRRDQFVASHAGHGGCRGCGEGARRGGWSASAGRLGRLLAALGDIGHNILFADSASFTSAWHRIEVHVVFLSHATRKRRDFLLGDQDALWCPTAVAKGGGRRASAGGSCGDDRR